jgi:hypothetical protein
MELFVGRIVEICQRLVFAIGFKVGNRFFTIAVACSAVP